MFLKCVLKLYIILHKKKRLRATLDKSPRSRDQWIQAILLVQSFKIGPKAFRWGSKTKKWQIEAKPTWHHVFEGKSIGSDQKTVLKGELLIWRTKNQAKDQGIE